MTQDEIIRMAREAGIEADENNGYLEWWNFAKLVAAHEREVLLKDNPYLAEQLQAYIHIATTVEREACAKVVNDDRGLSDDDAIRLMRAIRERGNK